MKSMRKEYFRTSVRKGFPLHLPILLVGIVIIGGLLLILATIEIGILEKGFPALLKLVNAFRCLGVA